MPGCVSAPIEPSVSSVRRYHQGWLERDGYPFWPFWGGGAQPFIPKGTNGRWREVLSREESATYEDMALEELGAARAHWLATGGLPG